MLESKEITKEKHVTALTLMYDGMADIALVTGNLEAAEALFKETLKGCLQQVIYVFFFLKHNWHFLYCMYTAQNKYVCTHLFVVFDGLN